MLNLDIVRLLHLGIDLERDSLLLVGLDHSLLRFHDEDFLCLFPSFFVRSLDLGLFWLDAMKAPQDVNAKFGFERRVVDYQNESRLLLTDVHFSELDFVDLFPVFVYDELLALDHICSALKGLINGMAFDFETN